MSSGDKPRWLLNKLTLAVRLHTNYAFFLNTNAVNGLIYFMGHLFYADCILQGFYNFLPILKLVHDLFRLFYSVISKTAFTTTMTL